MPLIARRVTIRIETREGRVDLPVSREIAAAISAASVEDVGVTIGITPVSPYCVHTATVIDCQRGMVVDAFQIDAIIDAGIG